MKKTRPVYRHESHEDLIQELGIIKDQDTNISIFERLADAFVFAACLGFQLNYRLPLPEEGKKEDIQWHIIEKRQDDALINLMGIAESDSLSAIEGKNEVDCIKIFEEYAHGGFTKIDVWRKDYPGDLFLSIIQGLDKENIITREKIIAGAIEF